MHRTSRRPFNRARALLALASLLTGPRLAAQTRSTNAYWYTAAQYSLVLEECGHILPQAGQPSEIAQCGSSTGMAWGRAAASAIQGQLRTQTSVAASALGGPPGSYTVPGLSSSIAFASWSDYLRTGCIAPFCSHPAYVSLDLELSGLVTLDGNLLGNDPSTGLPVAAGYSLGFGMSGVDAQSPEPPQGFTLAYWSYEHSAAPSYPDNALDGDAQVLTHINVRYRLDEQYGLAFSLQSYTLARVASYLELGYTGDALADFSHTFGIRSLRFLDADGVTDLTSQVDYSFDGGTQLLAPVATPEPSTAMLLAGGLALLLGRAVRRRRLT
jgi:hypothetical protein